MKKSIQHFEQVDVENIAANFSDDRLHRHSLRIPLRNRSGGNCLAVIGQNPSTADQLAADKTIRFLEEYIYKKMPQHDELIMLNLYTRVDPTCSETEGLLDSDSDRWFVEAIADSSDVLLVFGKLANGSAYRFLDRSREAARFFDGKRLLKFDLGTNYAPHPGNPRILYANFDVGLTACDSAGLTLG